MRSKLYLENHDSYSAVENFSEKLIAKVIDFFALSLCARNNDLPQKLTLKEASDHFLRGRQEYPSSQSTRRRSFVEPRVCGHSEWMFRIQPSEWVSLWDGSKLGIKIRSQQRKTERKLMRHWKKIEARLEKHLRTFSIRKLRGESLEDSRETHEIFEKWQTLFADLIDTISLQWLTYFIFRISVCFRATAAVRDTIFPN